MTGATKLPNGTYFLRWYGKDDSSGIASFDVQVQCGRNRNWSDWLVGEEEAEGLFKQRSGAQAPSFRVRARDKARDLGSYSTPLQTTGAPRP